MCIYAENVYIQHESEEIMEFSPDLELGRGGGGNGPNGERTAVTKLNSR